MDDDGSLPHPRERAELIGHEAAEAALLGAFAADRLPHAWLLAGPDGIGKATLAYRFARFLLAQAPAGAGGGLFGGPPESLHLDPEHPVFRRVASGSEADLVTVEREESERTGALSNVIRVDQIRKIVRFFTLTAGGDGWRVAIVDGADEMNPNAANALLKILEEPPRRALLLLVAHAPNRVIPTVRSRCRKLVLRPLDEGNMARFLELRAPALEGPERERLALLAEGRPGRALMLAAAGGLAVYDDLVDLLAPLPELDQGRVHALGDRLARRDGQAAYEAWLQLMRLWLNRLILTGAGRPPAEVAEGEGRLAGRLVADGGLDRWLGLWEKISRLAERAESVHLDRKQVVLNALLAIAATARG
jgi:DNA polymerase-3 subunit delta'